MLPSAFAATDNSAMKNLARIAVLAACAVVAACSGTKPSTDPMLLNNRCVVSGEAVDAGDPTVEYMGGKVAFCCKDCIPKWHAMDEAGKKAALDKAK